MKHEKAVEHTLTNAIEFLTDYKKLIDKTVGMNDEDNFSSQKGNGLLPNNDIQSDAYWLKLGIDSTVRCLKLIRIK